MIEIKYFLEDHWKKLLVVLILIVTVVVVVLMVNGGESEEGETNNEDISDTGLVTDDNYEEGTEDGTNTAEDETKEETNPDETNEDSSEDETEEQVEQTPEEEQEEVDKISYEEESIEYGEDMEFVLTDDLLAVNGEITKGSLDTVLGEYDRYDDLTQEDELTVEIGRFRFFGSNVNNCINEATDYNNCVSELLTQLKWIEGNAGEEITDSFKNMGELIANQEYLLGGIRQIVKGEDDNLSKVADALELELMIRADILELMKTFEGADEEYRMNTTSKVTLKLSQLTELESFVDNYMNQRMGYIGDE